MKATLKLFKAVPVKSSSVTTGVDTPYELMTKTIPYGFVFDPVVVANFNDKELDKLADLAIKEIGLSGAQMNSTFHKSWKKVATAPHFQLVLEQIFHYITTYSYEVMGVYDENTVYIPFEDLNIPDLELKSAKFTVIRGLTTEQLKEKLLVILESGIALAEDTVKDVVDVAIFVDLDKNEIEKVKNREVKVSLYNHLNIVPNNPVEFLRLVIYRAIGKTLIIKNHETFKALQSSKLDTLTGLFNVYEREYGLEKLATIFLRFKPLFLALRSNEFLKRKVNRIRKLAEKYHEPMTQDYFNTITEQISNESLNLLEFEKRLKGLNIFRKIRLANTLSYRLNENADTILYKIRNGKGFAKETSFDNRKDTLQALVILTLSIADDLNYLKGKKIYLPKEVIYTLPATEKQFTGMFPSGSYIKVDKDLVVGVYWENVNRKRIDLDLSMINANVKIGWDSSYRTRGRDVLFSGDMTDASKGAAEAYYVRENQENNYLLMLNYFNSTEYGIEVPFKIFVATADKVGDLFERKGRNVKNHVVDPNNVITSTWSKITAAKKQKILGIIAQTEDGCRFYFSEFDAGSSITAGHKKWQNDARKYLINFHESMLTFKEIFGLVGVEFVEEDAEKIDINLSPEKLEKDTFVNLLIGKI